MKALLRSGVATLAATVGAGMVVSVDDDDDDTNTGTNTDTGVSNGTQHGAESTGRSGDATGSRYSRVSRDRDGSRGDKSLTSPPTVLVVFVGGRPGPCCLADAGEAR